MIELLEFQVRSGLVSIDPSRVAAVYKYNDKEAAIDLGDAGDDYEGAYIVQETYELVRDRINAARKQG